LQPLGSLRFAFLEKTIGRQLEWYAPDVQGGTYQEQYVRSFQDRVEVVQPPVWMLSVGEYVVTVDRRAADREALRYALALHEDKVLSGDG
jgi:glycerate-2-kinase